ncbi:MAG: D-aminoacyl-tRNA deacylase [Gammaproteobacteria bacterium]|nr:D-aminoacyl-tRNA deacylase [Gammaproteobacteria bacterium]MDD9895689.1 D-aminoacyl-tRNA deacylase [Gammaproteobacteria bacterium]MDD9960132.1 D-aminoacyl-tRNA deacylase [Gammaproteobacteria bacterium]
MIALIQRVNFAKVVIEEELYSEIDKGVLALIGIEKEDCNASAEKLLERILSYRIFSDEEGKMNLSVRDVEGGLMLVSQFTLAAATDKGLRPSFSSAKPPAEAEQIFNHLLEYAQTNYPKVGCGQFAADMKISLENDGPVTFRLKV